MTFIYDLAGAITSKGERIIAIHKFIGIHIHCGRYHTANVYFGILTKNHAIVIHKNDLAISVYCAINH